MGLAVARVASTAALVVGIVVGHFFVFGPTATVCRAETVTPASLPGPRPALVCDSSSLWETQPLGPSTFPAPYAFIFLWTLAPVLAAIGVSARGRLGQRAALALVGAALLL